MINRYFFYLFFLILFLPACKTEVKTEVKTEEPLIGMKQLSLQSDIMTPEILWSFGRVGEFEVSPDNSKVLFSITYYDVARNRSNRELYIMSVDGSGLKQLTASPQNEFNYTWHPGGKKISYISSAGGTAQVWEMSADGTGARQVSQIEGGITGFKYSPDMKKIAYTAEVKVEDPEIKALYDGLELTTGKVYDEMMFRHWDEWRETYSHLFIADLNENGISNAIELLKGEPFDVPNRPFGGIEQFCWHPDGKHIAYSCHKKSGKDYAISTNTDIYVYDLTTGETVNLTDGMMGYDDAPVYSPDGNRIAWTSMARDGYEADKNRLMVMELATGAKSDYTRNFDHDAEGLAWSEDSRALYFVSYFNGPKEIFRLDMDGTITQLTDGIHDFKAVQPAGDRLIASMVSMSLPDEIFSVPLEGGNETRLTFTNKDILDQLSFGKVEKRLISTSDGKQMLTWVIYPPHFDPQKKYPALLYCQGGPQNAVSQFWSYRWNFQMMAANGYIVVAPNRRGVPGFGQEWKEQISGDYGGQNMEDLLAAIDEVSKEPYVDKDHLGAVGASYGGFTVYWLAGHHENRFKAFIAHDGMFNVESAYLETEEQWFPDFDMGGAPWEKDNPAVQKSYASSPHLFIEKWNTPILICHSEKDYRVVATQGIMAFNAAQLMGVPSQLLYFPDENHWVLKPQNGILWQRTFFAWLDKWLKEK